MTWKGQFCQDLGTHWVFVSWECRNGCIYPQYFAERRSEHKHWNTANQNVCWGWLGKMGGSPNTHPARMVNVFWIAGTFIHPSLKCNVDPSTCIAVYLQILILYVPTIPLRGDAMCLFFGFCCIIVMSFISQWRCLRVLVVILETTQKVRHIRLNFWSNDIANLGIQIYTTINRQ